MVAQQTPLDQVRAFAKRERKAGRQISWTVAWAVSRPSLKHIRCWFDDLPKGLNKAEAVEWLALKALEEIEADND